MVEHMLVPMALQLSLVFGATLWSVQRALAPVRQAVVAADALDPRDAGAHLDTTGMPAEIARLADAVNRALDRVRELVGDRSCSPPPSPTRSAHPRPSCGWNWSVSTTPAR